MILDNTLLGGIDLAHDATAVVVDLGQANAGRGEPLELMVQGSADLAGCTGIVITDGATDTAGDALITHTLTLAGKTHKIRLPEDVARYIKVDLVGTTSAGTWSWGVAAPPAAQSNL
jgi:hypothetical protein